MGVGLPRPRGPSGIWCPSLSGQAGGAGGQRALAFSSNGLHYFGPSLGEAGGVRGGVLENISFWLQVREELRLRGLEIGPPRPSQNSQDSYSNVPSARVSGDAWSVGPQGLELGMSRQPAPAPAPGEVPSCSDVISQFANNPLLASSPTAAAAASSGVPRLSAVSHDQPFQKDNVGSDPVTTFLFC